VLVLSSNPFDAALFTFDGFEQLKQLSHLGLRAVGKVAEKIPKELSGWTINLTDLDLGDNNLSNIPPVSVTAIITLLALLTLDWIAAHPSLPFSHS
jgi:Leucine-rich repeat (LRR) protein